MQRRRQPPLLRPRSLAPIKYHLPESTQPCHRVSRHHQPLSRLEARRSRNPTRTLRTPTTTVPLPIAVRFLLLPLPLRPMATPPRQRRPVLCRARFTPRPWRRRLRPRCQRPRLRLPPPPRPLRPVQNLRESLLSKPQRFRSGVVNPTIWRTPGSSGAVRWLRLHQDASLGRNRSLFRCSGVSLLTW